MRVSGLIACYSLVARSQAVSLSSYLVVDAVLDSC